MLRNDEWIPVPVDSAPAELPWDPDALACTGSSAFMLGVTAAPGQDAEATFLAGALTLHRLDAGVWKPVGLPAFDAKGSTPKVTALSVDHGGALWLATDADGAIHRYADGHWAEPVRTSIPSIGDVAIEGLAFDDEGIAWAIANLPGDDDTPNPRGLFLRFDGTAWSLRGVTWNPLRQRGFGLLGPAN
jgi:hypothetical protein